MLVLSCHRPLRVASLAAALFVSVIGGPQPALGAPASAIGSERPVVNALHVIAPYKYHGMWVFDDPRVGLEREPFVSGADTMIDRATASIPDAEHGFVLVFSTTPFPGHQITLDWRRGDAGGNWYFSPELKVEGWLCPSLFKYFDSAPPKMYVQVKERKGPPVGAAGARGAA